MCDSPPVNDCNIVKRIRLLLMSWARLVYSAASHAASHAASRVASRAASHAASHRENICKRLETATVMMLYLLRR